ncbi:pancreatic triacylglycerol lipase-like [Maniola jurtina]|uniref:pancreatic triacylglycerol lipase-like n=1 Tax=Maniola jurtina TaxID=191418 RepID=UPI001E687683|nr:pancreatic triacylglycerol lipase-like [Maniola jurtina]
MCSIPSLSSSDDSIRLVSQVQVVLSEVRGVEPSLPSDIILKNEDGPRYQYAHDSNGAIHLADLWLTLGDLFNIARYNPDSSNVYHLFTRANPTVSQPLTINNAGLLSRSNYNRNRRTIILIHGWMDSATSNFSTVLVPALLRAGDLNVIVVDWSRGANAIRYREANENTVRSGGAVARFVNWLNQESGSSLTQYHIIGHGLGGHQAGVVGRNLQGRVPYITSLDPALIGWATNINKFRRTDGQYTEVIHTNYGMYGYIADLGHMDFYPNGGISMPGCDSNACDHARAFFYMAESVTSGGFTGRQCINYYAAVLMMCSGPRTSRMGGLIPKTGETGVFLLETNAAPPFSLG